MSFNYLASYDSNEVRVCDFFAVKDGFDLQTKQISPYPGFFNEKSVLNRNFITLFSLAAVNRFFTFFHSVA